MISEKILVGLVVLLSSFDEDVSYLMIHRLGFFISLIRQYQSCLLYEARVRFETRVRVRVRVRDSAIFEKGGCGCGRTRRLKNY